MKKVFAATLVVVLLGGCASLTNNRTQAVIVRTTCGDVPVQGAKCQLMNPHGGWNVTTPGAVMITKAPGDMAVSCALPGVVADPELRESHATLGTYGNILVGGLVGFSYDAYNDAAWGYHPEVTIDVCKGQTPKTVERIQSVAADNGGTSFTPSAANTPALAMMESTLPTRELRYAVSAENVARQSQCTSKPVAVLSARGPATEVYTVSCNNGDALMLKCTWGDCKSI